MEGAGTLAAGTANRWQTGAPRGVKVPNSKDLQEGEALAKARHAFRVLAPGVEIGATFLADGPTGAPPHWLRAASTCPLDLVSAISEVFGFRRSVVLAGSSVVLAGGSSEVFGGGSPVVFGGGSPVVFGGGSPVVLGGGSPVVFGGGSPVVLGFGRTVVFGLGFTDSLGSAAFAF